MLRDIRGQSFTFSSPPRRVVSLVPSLTETLFDLGAGDEVVAVTDFCIFPENLDRPRVGGTKNPRVEAIRALQPDLVHMNLEENLRRHYDEIAQFAPVFVTEPKSVADVAALIETLGTIHARAPRAAELTAALHHELASMPRRDYTFAVPIWKKPWMWCGGDTYVSNLVETTGGRNVLRDQTRYPAADPESIDADVVFLPDEPYIFTTEDAALFGDHAIGPFPGHLFTWHGTRTIMGLRWLRKCFELVSWLP